MPRRGRQAMRATLWGLAGALFLIVGCFAPIAALPGGDAATLIATGSIPARLILVAALCSLALILARRRRALLLPAVFAGLLVLVEFAAWRERLVVVPDASPSADAIVASLSGEWGWALLAMGVGLLLLSGLFPGRRRRARTAPAGTGA